MNFWIALDNITLKIGNKIFVIASRIELGFPTVIYGLRKSTE
jgi:hypothetical protein